MSSCDLDPGGGDRSSSSCDFDLSRERDLDPLGGDAGASSLDLDLSFLLPLSPRRLSSSLDLERSSRGVGEVDLAPEGTGGGEGGLGFAFLAVGIGLRCVFLVGVLFCGASSGVIGGVSGTGTCMCWSISVSLVSFLIACC